MSSKISSSRCCTLFCHVNTRIALTILDILIGFSNILSYAIQFHNWSALTLTAMVTLVACHTLQMFLAEKKNTITHWKYSTFKWIMWIDITLGFLALGCFVVCFIIAGVTEIEFTNLYGENLWFTGLWATAITKYTWQNALLARNYSNQKRILKSEIVEDA
ncbi:Heme transporter hrg-5 [Caenorhabditis elegans]|uniref:Heme transporter hrg-5 n=1 Tax=Caenorhabditis elegans TaxID=6239 RepID=HRG5_CAEEL|nr:Heme transporter hrg-5 [Caenorhabditis elegans]Q7YTM8.1 RecName: Full=Heme transporter hrg-5; AltName: Full=Heme-responsive gene 5 protein; Short=CeHRG-5 [Caenorhabditis elegans]CAE17822.1 Heme transporter hrg-5 [Caenorhabditis elegans]|eukprot:NP_001023184.1 Heme transporter hrg-5 [Caenorhabditis elegans]